MPKNNQTILLADEDDATRTFLATNLTADGYLVTAAEDRAKTIALLSVDQPDLIIADVNGQTLDLLDAVRSGDGLAGHVDPDSRSSCSANGPMTSTASGCSSAVATTSSPSRSHTQSYARAWPPFCAELKADATSDSSASRRSQSTSAHATSASELTRSSFPPRSTSCWSLSPTTRTACSRAKNCCATCGATARRAGPSTAMRAD